MFIYIILLDIYLVKSIFYYLNKYKIFCVKINIEIRMDKGLLNICKSISQEFELQFPWIISAIRISSAMEPHVRNESGFTTIAIIKYSLIGKNNLQIAYGCILCNKK